MNRLPIFYTPSQSSSTQAASYSPSAGKPALAVADWQQHFGAHINIQPFEPASRELLYLAHSKAYVDGVLDGKIENGFGNTNKGIAGSLQYSVGSLVAAAEFVLIEGRRHAISPTSGFHHAGYNWGGGFCTFNALLVAALYAHEQGLAKRILILDFDQHYGNGTDDIIRHLGIDFITHITAVKSYETAKAAMAAFNLLENGILDKTRFDLVLYQAGADIHVDDPLGGLLTTAQMAQRDRNILLGCAARQIPVVVTLAGGYQRDLNGSIEPVLALHRETIRQCIQQNEVIHAHETF
jgi:acetoin utilization deacetylase AcuC-like enzyme